MTKRSPCVIIEQKYNQHCSGEVLYETNILDIGRFAGFVTVCGTGGLYGWLIGWNDRYRRNRVATESEPASSGEHVELTEQPTETEPVTEPKPVIYYICTDPKDPKGSSFKSTDTLDAAIPYCDRSAHLGYRVVTDQGETVYTPYTELQCDILRECKWVTDYVRDNAFVYGDAPVNPAINHRAKKVSCDRFVCWALYRVGFTDQPRDQGVVVSVMADWCERNGFERIDREEDLQPGDIVLVKYNGSWPAHTFIHAGDARTDGQYYRYDCGSNTRIQSTQPSTEPIYEFWRAYRAVADSPHRETTAE